MTGATETKCENLARTHAELLSFNFSCISIQWFRDECAQALDRLRLP